MKGYKVFHPDWTCRGFQYAVGQTYEEDITPSCCNRGFHFCTELVDCFNYYPFNPKNKIAEIEALGEIAAEVDDSKHCTNKIKIIREISWEEVLKMVNIGEGNMGHRNSGNYNSGNHNSGNHNNGNWNSGDCNSGSWNSGDCNRGSWNTGIYNRGSWNSGNHNSGNYNNGNHNNGNWNSGDCNRGSWNTGIYNRGSWNSGNHNSGNYNNGNNNNGSCNNGDWNNGKCNSGDWNKTNFSSGCFNTEESKIFMFNKPSNWTFKDWCNSEAKRLLSTIPYDALNWVRSGNMTDEEKERYPEYKTTNGYLKKADKSEHNQTWWNSLSRFEKEAIKSLPNFDAEIFKEITDIDVTI